MRMTNVVGFLLLLMGGCSTGVYALPTVENSQVIWTQAVANDPRIAGSYVYFYTPGMDVVDTQRLDAGLTLSLAVKTALPTVSGSLCFKITNYNGTGQESPFTPEACGWFGLPGPANVKVQ